ncbi:nuclear protein [Kwoniella heveanensis CBS 569]|uniref:Nuclear protein n=1 Tax=Kwoniella heveanensis BCC8398 TaxID=1296120 RepID=A0A1B9GRB0_9TREE|nr:nuclear protein [Kwoniella heveanensis BCC8398]OCF42583.1 nuclear protein [Kwoniella heveanensis CBS 569]
MSASSSANHQPFSAGPGPTGNSGSGLNTPTRPSVNSHPGNMSNPASSSAAPQSSSSAASKKRKASPAPSNVKPVVKERKMSVGIDPSTDDDAASTTSRQVREPKRTRVHFSCVECHRRKQKCDRKEPCSQCVARRVPHLCRPFLNGVEDPNANSDVHARLNSIETLLGRLVSALPSAMTRQTNSTNYVPTDASSPDVLSLTASGEEIFHPHATPPNEPNVPRVTLPHKPPPSGLFPSNMSYTTPPGRSGFGWGLREGRRIALNAEDNLELRDILQTIKESGISKSHIEWLIAGVPGRRMADGLVDLYFSWTRYKMNKASFMRRYNKFFDSIGRNPTCPKVDADTLKWLPLMFIVLAIATLSAPHELVPRDDQLGWARRFYGSARSGLEYAKAMQRDNLDVLFAGLLASRYMLLTRRPAEGSTPLTTAFQVGLYRDGTVLNLTDKKEIEIRRRAWSMLYHLDRTISLLVGRPASISDAHTDTQIPANLDDEEVESGDFDPAGHPLTKPTQYTYVIVRHKLAEIMGRIAYHTFTIQLPDYATVLSLDRELLTWRDALPPFFSMSNPDTSLDKTYPYLFVQRHLLACEWFYTRITLNRPYLLRRKPQDSRYAYSKNAAIESARADLLSRRSFVMEKGNLIVNSGGYRVLNSYMVLGVTIKLDPDSPQADELRQLLNVVSGRAPDAKGRTSEPLVKEELAIVEFLTAKSQSTKPRAPAPSSGSGPTTANPSDDQTPVDLLLGLAKTRSGKRAAEEEKRQLRLQAYREIEEQRQAARRNSGAQNISSSPWGYIAPQMPGLDVQQPFGNGKRVPRPLQPPPTRREDGSVPDSTNWSPEMAFVLGQQQQQQQQQAQAQAQAHAQSQNPIQQSQGQGQAHSHGQNQLQGPNHNQNQNQQGQLQNPGMAFNNSPTQALISPGLSQGSSQNQSQNQHQTQNNGAINLSPYNNLASMPLVSPSQSAGQLNLQADGSMMSHNHNQGQNIAQQQQQQFFDSSFLDTNGAGNSQQFGNALLDSFDFTDLVGGRSDGLGLGSGLSTGAGGGFNPFAVPQTEEGNEPMAEDDQTIFLNYILNKFANAQPDTQ